jgi:DNA polymerase zeta
MFVLLKGKLSVISKYILGRSVDQAVEIGQQMAREITKMHPYPIELKFEKVYCPFMPLAKKRYTGYKFEKKGDKPVLEGKGLETVRRDGVEACVKIMNKCLIELFETKNVSSVNF